MCQKENSKTLFWDNSIIYDAARNMKLKLTEIENEKFKVELNDVAAFLEVFNNFNNQEITKLDTQDKKEDIRNILREDVVKDSYEINEIILNAPSIEKRYFKVPKVIDND